MAFRPFDGDPEQRPDPPRSRLLMARIGQRIADRIGAGDADAEPRSLRAQRAARLPQDRLRENARRHQLDAMKGNKRMNLGGASQSRRKDSSGNVGTV